MDIVILLLAALGCLVMGGLVVNNPPLYDPPGFGERLKTYLTTHVAETRRNHRFPELELPCYPVSARSLLTRIEHTVELLDWEIAGIDTQEYRLQAVVTTSLLHFKDDVEIWLVPASCGTELHLRSRSRVGQGDLGANTRHILDLLETLGRQV